MKPSNLLTKYAKARIFGAGGKRVKVAALRFDLLDCSSEDATFRMALVDEVGKDLSYITLPPLQKGCTMKLFDMDEILRFDVV